MEFRRLYTGDSTAPIGCSLTLGREWEPSVAVPNLLGAYLQAASELPSGFDLYLTRRLPALDVVHWFVEGEAACCPFFTFELAEAEDAFVLRITGPAAAKPLLQQSLSAWLRS